MATELAEAYVQIIPSARGIKGEISKALGGEASAAGLSSGKLFASSLSGAAGVALAATTAAVGSFAKESLQAGSSFDAAMSQVAAISGAAGEEFDALREKAMEMGAKTQFSATESAEAFNYMAMAGWKTEDMLNGIEGVMNLAAASGENLGTVSDIVTDALTAFGLTAADSGHFADVLAAASSNANTNVTMMGETFKYAAPLAGALGFTVEDTAEAIGLMANAGIKSSQAGTSLRTILSKLNGTLELSGEALGDVEIETTNADGSMRELSEILGDLRGYFGQLTEAEMVYNAQNIAGKNAMSGFLALMNAAPADIDKLTGALDTADGAAQSMAETMLDNLSGDITIFKSALEGAQIVLSDRLTPSLRDFIQFGTSAVSSLSQAYQEGGLTAAMEALGSILSYGLGMIFEKLPEFGEAGMGLLFALMTGLVQNLPTLAKSAVDIVLTLAGGLTEALPELAPAVVDVVLEIVTTLTEPETLSRLVWAALQLMVALGEGLVKAVPSLIRAVPTLIRNLIGSVIGAAPQLAVAAAQLVIALGAGLVEAIPELLASVPKLLAALIGGLTTGMDALTELGVDMVRGLWEGIQSMGQWIGDKVKGLFTGLVDSIRGLLGIHSPSTVFAGIGKNMALGLGEGFDEAMVGVDRDMARRLAVSTDSISFSGDDFGGVFDGGNTYNISINASEVRELNDLIDMVQNFRRRKRMGMA